jgi:hypothetical protein
MDSTACPEWFHCRSVATNPRIVGLAASGVLESTDERAGQPGVDGCIRRVAPPDPRLDVFVRTRFDARGSSPIPFSVQRRHHTDRGIHMVGPQPSAVSRTNDARRQIPVLDVSEH